MPNNRKTDSLEKWLNQPVVEPSISVSDFSRGKASKVIREIQEGDVEKYGVIKNNKTVAYIISPDRYWKLEKDSEIVSFLYDLTSKEDKIYTASLLKKKIESWREDVNGQLFDWYRFFLDEMPEWQRERTIKAFATEEYAEPISARDSHIRRDEIQKIIETNLDGIRKAVEDRIKSYLDEELERMIVEETRKVLNSESNIENEQ